ncbi:MAG: hypothetical protein ACD_58C00325G0001 [uncultured bacterium]|nr:MAG: hypothetical protein ACD_58C00325G0001 [uncultured bacterium]
MNSLATLSLVVAPPPVNPNYSKEGITMFNNQVPPEILETAHAIADLLDIPKERIRNLSKRQILSFIEEKGECLK